MGATEFFATVWAVDTAVLSITNCRTPTADAFRTVMYAAKMNPYCMMPNSNSTKRMLTNVNSTNPCPCCCLFFRILLIFITLQWGIQFHGEYAAPLSKSSPTHMAGYQVKP